MVPIQTIQFITISLALSILAPVIAAIYIKRREERFSFRPLLIGALIWYVFTQLLEKLLHLGVISLTPIMHFPYVFALYGSLTAGIFEECARYFAFKRLLKKNHEWVDGISYGIGQGGIEAIFIGLIGSLQLIYISLMINANKVTELARSIPLSTLQPIVKTLVTTEPYLFMLSGIERIFALTIQIALSLVVLYSVRSGKKRYLLLAILLHALVDFPAALAQQRILGIWAVERILLLISIVSIIFITRSKKLLHF